MSTHQDSRRQKNGQEMSRGPAPFRPKVFLYRTLLFIFAAEFLFLGFAMVQCSRPIPGKPVVMVTERCPKLGERSETLFVAAITTTLSLLTGAGNDLR